MKLQDLTFTKKGIKRILAEATEREARDTDEERTINYSQLVQIAEEAQIDTKYLRVSTKQLVKEVGGLERATIGRVIKKSVVAVGYVLGCSFAAPTMFGMSDDDEPISPAVGILSSIIGYGYLFVNHEKMVPAVLGVQIATNFASGLYEWYRHEKNKLVEETNGNKK